MRPRRHPIPGFYGPPWSTPEPWRWAFDTLYQLGRRPVYRLDPYDLDEPAPHGTWRRVAHDLATNLETWVNVTMRRARADGDELCVDWEHPDGVLVDQSGIVDDFDVDG